MHVTDESGLCTRRKGPPNKTKTIIPVRVRPVGKVEATVGVFLPWASNSCDLQGLALCGNEAAQRTSEALSTSRATALVLSKVPSLVRVMRTRYPSRVCSPVVSTAGSSTMPSRLASRHYISALIGSK